jgi:hypothetical protein
LIQAIAESSGTVDLSGDEYVDDLGRLYANNMKRPGERTPEKVLENTAKGYGAEVLLMRGGIFLPTAPIVDDADTEISYHDRKADLQVGSLRFEVKTKWDALKYWEFGAAQKRSLQSCVGHCDFLIVASTTQHSATKYTYTFSYVADIDSANDYVFTSKFNKDPWRMFYLHHPAAINDGHAVDLSTARTIQEDETPCQ